MKSSHQCEQFPCLKHVWTMPGSSYVLSLNQLSKQGQQKARERKEGTVFMFPGTVAKKATKLDDGGQTSVIICVSGKRYGDHIYIYTVVIMYIIYMYTYI